MSQAQVLTVGKKKKGNDGGKKDKTSRSTDVTDLGAENLWVCSAHLHAFGRIKGKRGHCTSYTKKCWPDSYFLLTRR